MKQETVSKGSGLKINIRTYAMIGTLIVIWVIFQILTGGMYLTSRNMSLLVRQMAFTAVLTIGVTLTLIAGHTDLSLGSLAGLTGGICAIFQITMGYSPIVSILITLLFAAVLGIVQGFCVARFRIPAFIVTMGGLMAFRGILLGITHGRTIAPFSPSFKFIGQGYVSPALGIVLAGISCLLFVFFQIRDRFSKRRYGFDMERPAFFMAKQIGFCILVIGGTLYLNAYQGIPVPIVIVLLLAVLITFISRKTQFGRYVYAIGGNQEAARLSGINVERITLILFILCGIFTAIGGIILSARLNAGTPSAGTGAELDAIAAAVIGGTSLMGGVGSIPGGIIGALVMASLDNGMSLLNVDIFYQQIIKGVILVAAVGFDINAKR